MLAKRTPVKSAAGEESVSEAEKTNECVEQSSPEMNISQNIQFEGCEPVDTKDIALATRTGLRKMGIEVETPRQTIRFV